MENNKVAVPPLDDYKNASAEEILTGLVKTLNWTNDEAAENIGVDIDAFKSWRYRGTRPQKHGRTQLFGMIRSFFYEDVAEECIDALIYAWKQPKNNKDKALNNIGKIICQTALENYQITHLPALFEAEQSLPLATAYVELQLSPSTKIKANSLMLESGLSLRERLDKKKESRYSVRRSPQELIDENPLKTTLILGSPGVGKSSLLRRITLDIADGKWQLFKVPLFIEARTYWMARKSGKKTDLLTYAVGNMLPIQHNAEQALQILFKHKETQPFILLVDGLDEIASDSTAVNVIYNELKHLSNSISWVVTARPSGLMTSLGPVQRCEVVELDDESIEALIDNWCHSTKDQFISLDPEYLKAEIFGTSGTREMAQNPFLLTALCFLKSIKPNDDLPISRIQIYETLLSQIALQAQRKHGGDKNILAPHVIEALQFFVFDLYNHADGVIQIFDRHNWHNFYKSRNDISNVDFDKDILPSRLLSDWKGGDTQFHFLHLSLQEHLIARAMLEFSVNDALERRFSPAWRAIFRFYGSLLLQQKRTTEFRQLTNILYKEQDISRLSLLSLANIFADAGIRDTKDWIGDDLREELFISAMAGHDAGPESMYDALALLDSNWLEKSICAEMDEDLDLYESNFTEYQEKFKNLWLVATEDWHNSPYEKLAKTRTSSAKRIIVDAFWGENQNRAIVAAHAYARIATPSDRKKIVAEASSISMNDDMAIRIFAFSWGLYRAELIPFLGRLLDHFFEKANDPFSVALNLVADIGGKEAAKILENLAISESERLSSEFNAFEVVIKAVVRMGGGNALTTLKKLEELPSLDAWKSALQILQFEADPSCEEAIISALSDNGFLYGETLSALSGAANYGRIPSDRIMQYIRRRIDTRSVSSVMDLSFIESARIEAGENPVICDKLLELAEQNYARLCADEDENDLDYLLTNVELIFNTLGLARWKPAKKLIHTIFEDKYSNEHLLESVIPMAGQIYSGTSEEKILRHLKEILYQKDCEYSFVTALAIGRIDLELLYQLQSAEGANDALEEIAAESDLLIFDKFWVDRFGKKTHWGKPPKKISYVYNDEIPEIPQIFSHELSRYGFCFELDAPEECVAYLVFGENNGYWENVAKNLSKSKVPLINIPEKLTEEGARKMAREIGIEFLAKYEQMQPPSFPIHF